MSLNKSKNIYNECKHIARLKPEPGNVEEVVKSIGRNFNILPLFEKGLYDYIYVNHYSLNRNELLKCRWKKYKNNIEENVHVPFQFPSNRDLHFYNGAIRVLSSETLNRRPEHVMKLRPGPGVDAYGQIPIPQELHMRRYSVGKASRKHIVKKV